MLDFKISVMEKVRLLKMITLCMFFSACIKDSDFSTPTVECIEPVITVTNTIQQVKEMYKFGGATVIETDVVIEGYVVSSDESGNIYKTISIQDKPENATAAIKIAIDQTDLYSKYNVGRKIFVKLKGLAVGYSYGSFQIGKASGRELDRIASTEINNYVLRSCEVVEIIPKTVKVEDLNETMLEMLVKIENVQLNTEELGMTYGNLDNNLTVDRLLNGFSGSCDLAGDIILRNSGYADFKNELLPEGRGSITGVFSNYYEDFQLYIRDTDDVVLDKDRCDYSDISPTISLAEVRKMYEGNMVEFGVTTNYIVEAYVISSDEQGNFENKLVIQDAVEDPIAGIQILIEKESVFEQYNLGDKVLVNLNKLYMNENKGVLSVGFPNGTKIVEIEEAVVGDYVYNIGETSEIIPREIAISETLNSNYESTLVKVIDVQLVENELGSAFTFFSGENSASRTIETCDETQKLAVFTNGKSVFANDLFPQGHGSVVGVLSSNIEIRNIEDIQFTEGFEICPVVVPKIMITEIADPKNSVSSRFVELFNAGTTEIDLTGWKLNKYINGANSVSGSPIELNGITIPVGGFVVIANTGYELVFSETPTVTSAYISGNGDDVYELVDNLGVVIDVFGVVGEDGNGTNWEYLDGRVFRDLDIINPNNVFTISEWIVSSGATNLLINNPNTPKNAPGDYNPNYR